MSEKTTMSESTPLLEKGILPVEAKAADDRKKRAHEINSNLLFIGGILYPLNIIIGILAMHVISPAMANPVHHHDPYGNITRFGLCGVKGDGNLKINIAGPACAFTAGDFTSGNGPAPFQYFIPIKNVASCDECTNGVVVPPYHTCYLHDCADSDNGTPCKYATCK